MGKRSNLERKPKDFYPTTDPKAMAPRFVQMTLGLKYAEPCVGEGDLVNLLNGCNCVFKSDIQTGTNALDLTAEDLKDAEAIITNPPFSRDILLDLIEHLSSLKDTWLLLPADLMHNVYFGPYMEKCTTVISIGRLCWFPKDGKRVASTENYSWYKWPRGIFQSSQKGNTRFYGR